MKLLDLEPEFITRTGEESFRSCNDISEADGVMFMCPKCHDGDNAHLVICWQPNVPASVRPSPGRWQFMGHGMKDLTLHAGSSSVQLSGGCQAHFEIQAGEVRLL